MDEEIDSDESDIEEALFYGYFQMYMPDGKGVEETFAPLQKDGDAYLRRIVRIYEMLDPGDFSGNTVPGYFNGKAGKVPSDILMNYGRQFIQGLIYEAALHLLTGQKYNYSMESALMTITDHFKGDSDKAMREVQDTLLLLALDSDQDVGFCWWDAGEFQFFIRKEDLLAGNFENTYCSLYSS